LVQEVRFYSEALAVAVFGSERGCFSTLSPGSLNGISNMVDKTLVQGAKFCALAVAGDAATLQMRFRLMGW
jgi:hypothetical protein